MDNTSGTENISALFTNKFKDLYNSVGFNINELASLQSSINNEIAKNPTNYNHKSDYKYSISVKDVRNAIAKLKSNKKEENGLNINHFKIDSDRLNIFFLYYLTVC